MGSILKSGFAIIIVAGACAILVWLNIMGRRDAANEHDAQQATTTPAHASTSGGERFVILDRETQARVGMKTEQLAIDVLQPEVTAYGWLDEDPAQSFTLRSPIAGVLERAQDRAWPDLGDTLADGAAVGAVEPAFNPADVVSLNSQLVQSRANVAEAAAALAAARASFEAKKKLNEQGQIVPDRVLEEAQAKMKSEEARLEAAKETVRLIEESLAAHKGPAGPTPLRVDRGGQVVERSASPGEFVQAGQAILRVARFDRVLARIAFSPGAPLAPNAATARLFVVGYEDRPLTAEKVAIGASIDPNNQGHVLIFRVRTAGFPLRPGAAVGARVALPGEPQKGVVIPRSALVRFAGQAWAYVQVDDERFTRRAVPLEQPTDKGWFVTSGFEPNNRVVVAGAQTLLSEELKAQIEAEAEASE